MRKLFALVLLFMGCAFAQELVDVDVSKFPPNIVRKSSTTENAIPKVDSTTNTLVNSSLKDDGSDVSPTNATGSTALKINPSGRIYGNAVTVSISATTTHHTSNGTTVSIRATAHGLAAGQVILLAGFTWSDGGGVINGYHRVTSITDANNFVLTPDSAYSTAGALLVCPTTGTNPSVVGTVTVQARVGLGTALTQPMDETVAIGGKTVLEKNGIATTSTDGLVLKNVTAATVGTTVQYSPRLRLRAQAWDTDGSNDTFDYWFEIIPTSGTTTSALLYLYVSKNGAAATQCFRASNDGTMYGAALSFTAVTGASSLIASSSIPSAGTMTAAAAGTGIVRTTWNRYNWTNAMVTALGAVTSGDITVCTLNAKTRVIQAYVVITGQGVLAGATLTGQLGTDATFSNYLNAGDLKAAANTVYGDADAEMGGALWPTVHVGHLSSWTATTAVKLRVTTDGAGGATLAGVTASTGSVYLLTEVLP